MSLLSMAKAAMPWPTGEPVFGDGFVVIPVEARDALVELAEAATTLITAFYGYDDDPLSAKQAQAALERLRR